MKFKMATTCQNKDIFLVPLNLTLPPPEEETCNICTDKIQLSTAPLVVLMPIAECFPCMSDHIEAIL